MKRICVISGSRADYGLLYWTLTKLKDSSFFELQICVTGMHLSHEFGMTYKMIEKDDIKQLFETIYNIISRIKK